MISGLGLSSDQCPPLRLLRVGLLLAAVGGCGPRATLVPVRGRVVVDGKPLANGSVMFQPTVGPAARGQIGADGGFELGTYRDGDGVRPGQATVRVTSVVQVDVAPDQERPPGKSIIPLRYADFGTSGITVDVAAGMQPVTIELSSK